MILCAAMSTCSSLALPGEAFALFEFRFQLVYTSLEEQLVKIKELWDLASRQKGKERDVQNSAKQRLSAIIQAHTPCHPPACTAVDLSQIM